MSHKFESFADIERALEARSSATKRYTHSLDHVHELLDFLGNPHKRLRVVHVAGTSGKTSTAYYAAALLQQAGKTVGLTVSPHVDNIGERVQVNLAPLSEKEFCSRFSLFYETIKGSRVVLNYFELFIVFAFWEFASRKVDYVVAETGVGGLLDSTNVFDDPEKVCVITDIGFDHMRVLGNTLPEIAAQKAGIIQLHNAVFCNRQEPEVMEVIRDHAERKQADMHILHSPGLGEEFNFLPLFQRRNFGLAQAAAQFVLKRDKASQLLKGKVLRAAYTHIPARMETVTADGKIIILDIAHNSQKLHALLESVKDKYPGQRVAALIRMPVRGGEMKRTPAALEEVAHSVDHVIITSLAEEGDSPDDSFNPDELAKICRQAGLDSLEVVPDPRAAFETLRARHEPVLLVTGSTFLLNHIRPLLKAEL